MSSWCGTWGWLGSGGTVVGAFVELTVKSGHVILFAELGRVVVDEAAGGALATVARAK